MVRVAYKDGTEEVFKYGDEISSNSGGGFNLRQHMGLTDIRIGSSVKKGDILAYNTEFFKQNPYNPRMVEAVIGVTANVAIVDDDVTLDDSSTISEKLASRLEFVPVYSRTVVITKDTMVHRIVQVGDHVQNIDPLMVFDESEMPDSFANNVSDELVDVLSDLNRATPKSKYSGTIKRIDVFHKCDLSEMSESVRKLVRMANTDKNKRAEFAKGAKNDHIFPSYAKLEKTDRIGVTPLDHDTIVIRFYIEHATPMDAGSKIIFSSSLKSVDAEINPYPIYGEDGIEVDARSSWRGVQNRLLTGVMYTGVATRILDKLEQDILKIFDEE